MLPVVLPDDTLEPLYCDYLKRLRKTNFAGEIRTDYATRLAVATDNSIYQVIPQAVIFPRGTHDISVALKLSQQDIFHPIKFSARGGGTGTNGQSLSHGIILDCSKYLHQILEVNLEQGWARVQPGVVLDQLNSYLKKMGVHFAPEISPSNRATIGGMINTDACGNGSKTLGRTSDHVVDLTCVLANGDVIHTNQITHTDQLYQELNSLLQNNQQQIHEKFFAAPRTLSGYNLAKASQNGVNLNYLLCGAEGTLGIISECKLKLSPLPKYKRLVVVKYRNFNDALRAHELIDVRALVIESIDEKLIALARQDTIYLQIKDFIQDANAINLVEFVSDDLHEINQQLDRLVTNITNSQYSIGYYVAKNDTEIKLLWELRKKSVGLISKRRDGTRRPIPFIEDTAVPPHNTADYIQEFKELLDRHQLIYGMYGHVDAGCIHVRPALDMRLTADEKLMRELSDQVVALVKKYNGVIWGEHGKGYRSEYGAEFFGDELYFALRQIKTLFDPYNQLNPGKIVTPIDSTEAIVKLDSNLRGHFDKQISSETTENYASAIACNGNGACFNYATNDVMCPSFKVTQDRIHSPKGRSAVIREWLRLLAKAPAKRSRHLLRKKADFSHEVFSALSGCLGCKACANQCPLNVDVPEFKAKFLERYYTRYSRPLRDYFIARAEVLAQWQAKFPRISNWIIKRKLAQSIIKFLFKLVDLPTAKVAHFPQAVAANGDPIVILQDAFTSFYEPHILTSFCNLLTKLGFSVRVEPFFVNGKPFHVKGFLNKFNLIAKRNIAHLREIAKTNQPIVGIDPSITLTYRDEYQKVLSNEKLNFTVQLPQEFLATQLNQFSKKLSSNKTYFLLSHCTEKTAQTETDKQWQAIFAHFGLNLISLPAGCCGMAGSYGHELENLANSRALFNLDWQNHLYEHSVVKDTILSTGYSCRSQAQRFAGIKLQHPLEILAAII